MRRQAFGRVGVRAVLDPMQDAFVDARPRHRILPRQEFLALSPDVARAIAVVSAQAGPGVVNPAVFILCGEWRSEGLRASAELGLEREAAVFGLRHDPYQRYLRDRIVGISTSDV